MIHSRWQIAMHNTQLGIKPAIWIQRHCRVEKGHWQALTLTILLTLMVGCSKPPTTAEDKTQAALAQTITVARVVLRPMTGTSTASGLLVPREEAAVSSELSGYRVADVLVEEGATVKVGDSLVRLDPDLLQAQITKAKASLTQARAQALQPRKEAARVATLDHTGALSAEQIEQRRSQATVANATVAVTEAQLNELQVQARHMVIRAPVSGIVLERNVRPGDIASPSQPMFRIARDGLIELDAEVPEEFLVDISIDEKTTVTLPSGQALAGTVRRISPRVDPRTKLGRVRVSLPLDPQLRAGGYARATFKRTTAAVPAVPETAIQFDAGGPMLVVIDAQQRAHHVAVKTGNRVNGFVAIENGPPVGSRIALGGGAFLLDGDPVNPQAANTPPTVAEK